MVALVKRAGEATARWVYKDDYKPMDGAFYSFMFAFAGLQAFVGITVGLIAMATS